MLNVKHVIGTVLYMVGVGFMIGWLMCYQFSFINPLIIFIPIMIIGFMLNID